MKRLLCMILSTVVLFSAVMASVVTVDAKGYDRTAPIIKSITFNKDSVIKPGVLKLTFDVVEEETGVSRIEVGFMGDAHTDINDVIASVVNPRDEECFDIVNPHFTGKFSLEYGITTRFPSEELHIGQIDIYDKQGNHRTYWMGWEYGVENGRAYLSELNNENEKCYINYNNTVEIQDEFDVEFQSYITNNKNPNKISDMDNDGVAMINFDDRNFIAPREYFELIKGTNKTIVFSDGMVQWVFNGKNVNKKCKDISLKTDISMTPGFSYNTDKNVIVVDFASNGELPGKANFRMKSDYIHHVFGGNYNKAYVYYDSGSKISLEKKSKPTFIEDAEDTWAAMDVSHNSRYVLSKVKLNKKNNKSVKLSNTTYVYDGKVKKPKITITNSKNEKLIPNQDYTVKYAKGRKNVGKYAVDIIYKGRYQGSDRVYFSVLPKQTSVTKVVAGKKKFTVKYKKQTAQTTGYQIRYSTSQSMNKAKTVKVPKNTTIKQTISGLKGGKRYYVQVRTYKMVRGEMLTSSWSKVKSVKTK